MGEFRHDVERILDRIRGYSNEQGGIDPKDLPDIVADKDINGYNRPVNCYPGVPGNKCYETAYFFALGKPFIKTKRNNLDCRQAIEKVIMHMQGYCTNTTRTVIFVTDNWDKSAYEDWYYNLQEIKKIAYMEVYLVTRNNLSEIQI